jgi:hypothetical protein
MKAVLENLDAELNKRKKDAHEEYQKKYSGVEKVLCALRKKWSYLAPIILVVVISIASYVRTVSAQKKMRVEKEVTVSATTASPAFVPLVVTESGEPQKVARGGSIRFNLEDLISFDAVPFFVRIDDGPWSKDPLSPGALQGTLKHGTKVLELRCETQDFSVTLRKKPVEKIE